MKIRITTYQLSPGLAEAQHRRFWHGAQVKQLSAHAKKRLFSLDKKAEKAVLEGLKLDKRRIRLKSEIEAGVNDPVLLKVKKVALCAILDKMVAKTAEIAEIERKKADISGEKDSRAADKFPRFRDLLVAEFAELFGENAGGTLSFEEIEYLCQIPAKNVEVGRLERPDDFSPGKGSLSEFKLLSGKQQQSRNLSAGKTRRIQKYRGARAAWIGVDEDGNGIETGGASEYTRHEAGRFRPKPAQEVIPICPKCGIVIMAEPSVMRVGREYHGVCWP